MIAVHGEQFTWATRDGVAVVYPPSELDLSNADRLRESCQVATESAGPRVVVDLAGTRFLDSTVLNVFVQVAKQLQAEGGWLRLASGESSVVRKVLEITRLDASLGNYPSVETAMEG